MSVFVISHVVVAVAVVIVLVLVLVLVLVVIIVMFVIVIAFLCCFMDKNNDDKHNKMHIITASKTMMAYNTSINNKNDNNDGNNGSRDNVVCALLVWIAV